MKNRWTAAALTAALGIATIGGSAASATGGGSGEPLGCDEDYVQLRRGAIEVAPNGVDDTENVECAVDKATELGVQIVRLDEGTFHLDFLFVEGFDGRLAGAGRDHTTIEPLDGGLDCKSVFDALGFVFWLVFLDSNLTITDLALSIPDVACEAPWLEVTDVDPDTGEILFQGSFQDFEAMVLLATRTVEPTGECGVAGHVSLTAKRIDVDAPQPDFLAEVFNPQGAFSSFRVVGSAPDGCPVPDPVIGDIVVTDNSAEGVGNLIQASSITDSRIMVRSNHMARVDTAIILSDNDGTVARVSNNTIEEGTGVGVVSDNCSQFDPGFCQSDASRVLIANNQIHMTEIAGPAIVGVDGDPGPPLVDLTIRRNHISGDGNFAGVFLNDVDGARVNRNTFAGASVFAVLAEGETTQSRINKNDMTGHFAFEAGILLAPDTSLNVVRRNLGATVVDLGTDNIVQSEVPIAAPTERTTTSTAGAGSSFERNWSTSYWSTR